MKINTLKKKIDFDYVFKNGKYSNCNYYRLVSCPNDERDQIVRFGFVINKKYGKAVKRNRTKRQLKEIFRSIEKDSIKNMDFVIMVNNAMGDLEFSELKTAVINNIKRFIY